MRIRELFNSAVSRLRQAGIPDPEAEAALLLSSVLKMSRTRLLLAGEQSVAPEELESFETGLCRRLQREPAAYILGEQEFWSLSFRVSPAVLIPRPETEILVESVLRVYGRHTGAHCIGGPALDLGTGSGVIAIVLALELGPPLRFCGVDYSYAALRVAAENAKRHHVRDRIDFINADWFSALAPGRLFDLIVANPPYVAKELLDGGPLQPEVVVYEPRLALDGGSRGIETLKHIAGELESHLKPGGWFFMEIGADQAEEMVDFLRSLGGYDSLDVHNDYAGLPRVLQARRKPVDSKQ